MRFGPNSENILTSADSATIAINATATVYTKSFTFKYGEQFALIITATSSGTVDLKIELEQSDVVPATEGSVDTNYVVPENMGDIVTSLGDENRHIYVIRPAAVQYGRLKITGGATNDASTTVAAKLSKLEQS